MALKGKSFSVDPNKIEMTVRRVMNIYDDEMIKSKKRMDDAVEIVYRTARARRPMITVAQAKAEGRGRMANGKIKRVSNPDATAGVPVRQVNGGALQISIKKESKRVGDKLIGRVYTQGIPYAMAIEYGTSKMRARPFMRPALNLQIKAIIQLFRNK